MKKPKYFVNWRKYIKKLQLSLQAVLRAVWTCCRLAKISNFYVLISKRLGRGFFASKKHFPVSSRIFEKPRVGCHQKEKRNCFAPPNHVQYCKNYCTYLRYRYCTVPTGSMSALQARVSRSNNCHACIIESSISIPSRIFTFFNVSFN